MIICEKIILKNFRRYVEGEFEFSNKLKNNLNVVIARNGVGKSTLFDAFTWCFFGKEDHLKIDAKYLKESEKIINMGVLTNLKNNSKAEVIVTVFLCDLSNNKRYKIKRVVEFFRGKDGAISSDEGWAKPKFWVWDKGISDWQAKIEEIAESRINSIIPQDLRQFFFFDGEQLRSHFEGNTSGYLQEKIEQVSRIDLLDNCLNHLNHYLSMVGLKKRRLSTNKELTKKENRRDILKRQISEKQQTLNKNKKRLTTISQQIRETKEKIQKIGIDQQTVNVINEQIEETEKKISEESYRKKSLEEQYKKFLLDYSLDFFMKDYIKKSLDLINKAIKNKEVPPPITKDFLNRLLNEYKECICGTSLKGKDNLHRKRVEALEKETEVKFSVNYNEGILLYDITLNKIKNILKEIEHYKKTINECDETIRDSQTKLDGLKLRRKRAGSSVIGNLQTKLNLLENEEKSLKNDNNIFGDEIEGIDIELEGLKREIEKGYKHQDKLKALNKKQEATEDVQEIISQFKQHLIDKNIKFLKDKTESYFRQICTEKSEEIEKIEIDPDFNLKIISKMDPSINLKHTLSQGEQQIFILAFAAALRDITKIKSPLIIDTPLGRIDPEYRIQVLHSFPKILDESQLILLVTKSEYTKEVYSKLKSITSNVVEYEVLKTGIENKIVRKN